MSAFSASPPEQHLREPLTRDHRNENRLPYRFPDFLDLRLYPKEKYNAYYSCKHKDTASPMFRVDCNKYHDEVLEQIFIGHLCCYSSKWYYKKEYYQLEVLCAKLVICRN
ncbi:hypothetical protein ACJMK2_020119 [Sinanodonta woodiana]|uniref:Uncharacterized protein n=1 Tax=Sinanodonta woodiana TaxID=1069815 RepID=A0ABD3TY30_SINWO